MSIFKAVINNVGIGRAGTSTVLCINNHSSIDEAKKEITEWIERDYVQPVNVDITFINHSTELFVSDLSEYEKIKIFQ